jgi:hypothetical protein
MRLPALIIVITLQSALSTMSAQAQSVAGRLTDESTGRPVAGATVWLQRLDVSDPMNPMPGCGVVAIWTREGIGVP